LNVFATLRGYRAGWFGGDLLAGLMLAAIAIPEQLATAKLAGFPVEAGFFAFAAGTLAFALLGTNRFASVGADSTIAPIFAGSLGALVATGGTEYRELAGIVAIGAGAILVAVGFARAGWVADLLSVPVTTGFLAGISAHIVIGQLPSLFGIAKTEAPLILQFVDVIAHIGAANPYTLALGIAVLAVTLAASRVSERIPGALIGLVCAGAAVAAFHLRERGVAVLGDISVSVPRFHLPLVHDVETLLKIAPLALVVAAVCALQTSVVVRSFPSNAGASDDPSGDFVAVGAGSILSALSGAFAVNASPPRTAVAKGAGGRSQMSGLVALAALVAIVAFFSHLAAFVPQAALAGVLIFIGMRIFRLGDMLQIARRSPGELNLVFAGALLVIVFPIQTGMLLAIMLSLVHGVTLVMWPPATQLFQVRGTTVWWPRTGERDVMDVPGIVVFAPAAPVNFTNAEYVRQRLLAVVAQAPPPVKLVVIEASAVTDVDYTGGAILQTAIEALKARNIEVALARLMGAHANEAAERSGLIAAVGMDHVFLSVADAVAKLSGEPATPRNA
jgi:MFS superfamily sulfate permease-like transporter